MDAPRQLQDQILKAGWAGRGLVVQGSKDNHSWNWGTSWDVEALVILLLELPWG